MADLDRVLTCLQSFKTREIVVDPIVQTYSELTSEDKFEDGAITYLTGGSIANLFIKTDLGYELDVMDWVWAGVDVASIAITAATWGSGGAATIAGKTAVMVAVRQGAKLAVRTAARTSVKAATRVLVRSTVKAAGREIVIDGICLAVGEACNLAEVVATVEGSDNPVAFRELPEELLNGTDNMDNIPNASYAFPNSHEESFRTDTNGNKF